MLRLVMKSGKPLAQRIAGLASVLLLAVYASSAPGHAQSPRDQSPADFFGYFASYSQIPPKTAPTPGAVDITSFTPPAQKARSGKAVRGGMASWYGPGFAGRRTANGETFNPRQMTAAHRTLPFGSKVRVTHARSGRSVIVRINDRGPYAKGRVIDLSQAAARKLGIISAGHARVNLALLAR